MSRSVRRVSILFALVAAISALAPVAAQARAPRGFIGLSAERVFAEPGSYRTQNLSTQAAIGVQLHRQTFDWRIIEQSRGRYNLTYHDDYVAALAAKGIRVLPVLFNPPSFHTGTSKTRPTYPPKRASSMARFARVLVRRYGPSGSLWKARPGLRKVPITSWQIWNEPNLPVYWRGRPNARSYVRLVKTVSRSIRRVHRRAEVVSAGLPPSTQRGVVSLNRFIRQIYRAGIGRSISSLAINSYARNTGELARLLRSTRRLMNRSGGRRDKIWITEIGWATQGPVSRFNVGPARQASLITSSYRFIRQQRRRLKIRGVIHFAWRDQEAYAPLFRDLWGLNAGLIYGGDGGPKPGFFAYKNAVDRF